MAKDSVRLPQSTAGIMGFSSDEDSIFKIHPGHVIAFILLILILLGIFKNFSSSIIGI
ncbi:MAG: hypothetical protein ACQER9_04350 [Nanobdellota archaeon]